MRDLWIRTDRLVLRPWEESDANRLVLMTQDQDFQARWGVFREPMDAERALEWVRTVRHSVESEGLGSWAVVENAQVVGCASLLPRWADLEDHSMITVEYRLLHSAQGRGLATEAMLGLINFGQIQHSIKEFHAFVTPENTQAKNVAFKLGMQYWRMGRMEGVVVEIYRTHAHPGQPATRRNQQQEEVA